MADETATGPVGAFDGEGHSHGGGGDGSPLQTRAAFLKNWDWQSVVGINRGACQRGGAQHGFNSETSGACAQEWEALREGSLTLSETLDRLRGFHRKAPFLFYNGSTFATIGRELALVLFSDLPPIRKREVASAIAHFIAGVLDREDMAELVDGLCAISNLQPGCRVKTLRGSTRGVVVRVMGDGKVLWRPDGASIELLAAAESLMVNAEC